MYQYKGLEDTIVAISTAPGQGGIGIVRLSGKDSLSIADKIFRSAGKGSPQNFKSHTLHYGWVADGERIVDEAILSLMRAPRSYTREDVVEISCHGGAVSLRTILNLAVSNGARLAEPGEFTKRAFLNGRIDLPQAEAVLDVIQSKTDAFLRVSTNQLKGELSTELENIRDILMNIYTQIEAVVNFPEDEIDAQAKESVRCTTETAKMRVDELLSSSDHGLILKEGIKIVLCGRPNAGKSSLLNIFLKEPRAIVSDIEGTTRDTIEETAQIGGIPFKLVDTAGILEPRDVIEEEAVKRSRASIKSADLVLLMLDASRGIGEEDKDLMEAVAGQNVFVIINKCDLGSRIDVNGLIESFPKDHIFEISVLKKDGIKSLENAVVENVWRDARVDTDGVMVSNIRHVHSLQSCRGVLQNALNSMEENLSLEFVSEDIKAATNFLDSITGRNIDHDLLDTIFSQFCIGK